MDNGNKFYFSYLESSSVMNIQISSSSFLDMMGAKERWIHRKAEHEVEIFQVESARVKFLRLITIQVENKDLDDSFSRTMFRKFCSWKIFFWIFALTFSWTVNLCFESVIEENLAVTVIIWMDVIWTAPYKYTINNLSRASLFVFLFTFCSVLSWKFSFLQSRLVCRSSQFAWSV